MKHLLTAALAAAALGLGLGSIASAATPPPQTQAEQRATEAWLADLARWSSGYNTVLAQRAGTLEWLSANTQQLVAKLEAGQKDSARAFAAQIGREGQARLDAEMQAYQTLPTEAPTFPLIHLIPPSQRGVLATYALMPDRFGTMMIRTDQAARAFIEHLAPAASGRPEDMKALIGAYYGLAIARSEAAIAMTESGKGAGGSNGDSMDRLRDILIENERAMIVWTRFNRAVELGEPFDEAEAAEAIRAHANAIRDTAGEMARQSNGEVVRLRSTPSIGATPLGQMMQEGHLSLVRSANVEYGTADLLDRAARAIETYDADPAAAAQILDGLATDYEGILRRRLEEDAGRRRLLAQNGA